MSNFHPFEVVGRDSETKWKNIIIYFISRINHSYWERNVCLNITINVLKLNK